jgi:D-serine deaminase-like pyridoxal phosphate-dependent protein
MGVGEPWARYLRALGREPLPSALVDLDALEANVDRLLAPVVASGKRLRLATKSVRCPAVLERIASRAGETVIGLMTYTAGETAYYAGEGAAALGAASAIARDLLLAYPTVHPADAALLAEANRHAHAKVVVDELAQLAPLAAAARQAGTSIPVVIELDLGWRPLGRALHLGVRRSPLRSAGEVLALARAIAAEPSLRFAGLMGYEAQLAGLPDTAPTRAWQNPIKRALKRGSRPAVARARAEAIRALGAAGLAPELVNGGGTGSVAWSSGDETLSEITVGSGFLAGHLFDHYAELAHAPLSPALHFALQAVRRPAPRLITCHGGGFIASGATGEDRQPLPVGPPGCRLLAAEGAGEVQTPLALPAGVEVALGDPIFFRPAKSGELAEHFDEYLLVRGEHLEARAPTYRGLGRRFLG